MDLTHIHLLLNHFPTIGTIIGGGLFLVSLIAKSDDLKRASLVVLLGNPTTCPHGNPIPGVEPIGPEQRRLDEAVPGDRIRLERITESVEHEAASLSYLGDNGLTPGTTAIIQAKAPDGTLTLVVGETTIALGPAMTQRMFVASA